MIKTECFGIVLKKACNQISTLSFAHNKCNASRYAFLIKFTRVYGYQCVM